MRKMSWVPILLVLLLVQSCSTTSSENADADEIVQSFDKKTIELLEETHKIVPITNPATSAARLMINLEAPYNPQMLAIDFDRSKSYIGSTEKMALNLGRMIVDLVYLDVFDQDSLAVGLFGNMETLADSLGVARSFNQFMYMRYIDLMDSNDSTRQLILDAIESSKEHLRVTNRTRVSALITTGEFFETLFITTQILDKQLTTSLDNNEHKNLMKAFRDLDGRLGLLINLLEKTKTTGDNQAFFDTLTDLKQAFEKLPDTEKELLQSAEWHEVVEITAQMRNKIVTL